LGSGFRKHLTASEPTKLLTTLKQPRSQRLEVVIMLALYAGLRQQEIIWLTWEDVDLADGWLHFRSKPGWSPKSASSERSIPIAHRLAEFLADSPRISRRWVAPGSPRGYIPDYLAGRATIIHPALDPQNHKNRELPPHKLVGILCNGGLQHERHPVVTPPLF
jgi:integrase